MKSYAYISLEDVLQKIVEQAKKDVGWMRPRLSGITSIEQLFYRLKDATTYRDDPPNTELIQSPRSLFEKNFYNKPGTGDCDCFTCLSICCFAALGINPDRINLVLTGDTASIPLHIYSEVDGYSFDLTNESFNFQRPYRYSQLIPLSKLWKPG